MGADEWMSSSVFLTVRLNSQNAQLVRYTEGCVCDGDCTKSNQITDYVVYKMTFLVMGLQIKLNDVSDHPATL